MCKNNMIASNTSIFNAANANKSKETEPAILIDAVHHLLQRELTIIQRKGKTYE